MSAQVVRGYRAIQEELPKRTKVPLRFPTFIPYGDEKNPIFATVESVDVESYQVQLAWAADCNGGNWCHLGEISGSTRPIPSDGPRVRVVLRGGVGGDFIDSTCGAHCSDSAIYWREGGYYYSIAIKAEKKATLVKMANSAITPGGTGVR
jgi:hypothetical protein